MSNNLTRVKLAEPDEITPSFSSEFFAIELLPVATASAIVTAVFLAGAPGKEPGVPTLVQSIQSVTAVSLSVWVASVVLAAILLRPISRQLFTISTAGLGSVFPDRFSFWSNIGPGLPLGRAADAAFAANLESFEKTGLNVRQMKRLLPEDDQRLLEEQRYSW